MIFKLSKEIMIVHLRMEGKFFIRLGEPKDKHEHVIFVFESGKACAFNDVRKFGTITLRTKENTFVLPSPCSV